MSAEIGPEATIRFDYAETLLSGDACSPAWPRCAAWLIRLGLEYALGQLWAARYPSLTEANFTSQLLALRVVVDADTAQRAAQLWSALSRAGHHHHYELEPSAGELRGWLDEARVLVGTLSAAAPATR